MSLFLLTSFDLVHWNSIARGPWCLGAINLSRDRWPLTFLLPNPGLGAASFALVLNNRGGYFTPRGLGVQNNILAKIKEVLPGFWKILIKYSEKALSSKLLSCLPS